MNKILWEPWKDPLHEALEKLEDADYTDNEVNIRQNGTTGRVGPVIIGPLGVMPISVDLLVSKKRRFWEANTNFDVTPNVIYAVERTIGVEIMRVLTRYMFVTSFGKAFVDKDIIRSVNKVLGAQEDDTEKIRVNRVNLVKGEISHRFRNWAVYVLASGKIESYGDNLRDKVFADIAEHKKLCGTKIYTSWD